MRLRTVLLSALPLLLLLSLPGIAVSSASDYRVSSASLRALWVTQIASGLPAAQLAPLQSELALSDSQVFVGVPIIVLNPSRARSLIASLQARTNALYRLDLSQARAAAFTARLTLLRALTSPTILQTRLLSEELASANSINDYSFLAAAWSLDALLIPLDHSLATRQITLTALVAQANSLSVSTTAATSSTAALSAYFNLTPTARYAFAPSLLVSSATTLATLQSSLRAEISRRAAIAKAKAEAAARAAALAAARPAGLYLYLSGIYTDCSGATPVKGGLYRNPCLSHTIWLEAHKWSIGRSFFSLHVGSHIYFQNRTYTVYRIFTEVPADEPYGPDGLATSTAPLRLETCFTDSGSMHLIILAR